jgi:Flp pilus assembly protein TadG
MPVKSVDREIRSSAMFDQIRAKTLTQARRVLARTPLRRLLRQEDGATAVEFGMVAAPFLALVFAIIETAVVFFAGQTLETAIADASRLILTGQAQQQNFDAAAFKQAVCARIFGLFDCQNGIKIDVQKYNNFAGSDTSKPLDGQGDLQGNFGNNYNPGGPGDIIVVRAIYEWPVYVQLLGFNMADMKNGKRLIMATAAFRNEPYQ